MMTPKRKKIIKIRVSESELLQLREICPEIYLAQWMREICLGQQKSKRGRTPRVDPQLIRQLAAIGNNLNQIARVMNQDKWCPVDRMAVCMQLNSIERELSKLTVKA